MHRGFNQNGRPPPPPMSRFPRSSEVLGPAGFTAGRWVGGPTAPLPPPRAGFGQRPAIIARPLNQRPPKSKVKAPSHLPPEITLQISQHLDAKDLARGALVWRPLASVTQSSPEWIRMECARYSLLLNHPSKWSGEQRRAISEQMGRHNFAWSTMLYSTAAPIEATQMTSSTPWAGSYGWKSGSRFTGESNGYIYDVSSQRVGSQLRAEVTVYRLPSLRKRQLDLVKTRFDLTLHRGSVKAVTVDPVGRRVAVLEFDNIGHPNHNLPPVLHLCSLDGKPSQMIQIGLQLIPSSEIYHLELHKDMVCIVANYPSSNHNHGMESLIVLQNWRVSRHIVIHEHSYCTGFQFITEDLYIMTTRQRTGEVFGSFVQVGHVGLNSRQSVNRYLQDKHGKSLMANGINLVRNKALHAPAGSPYYTDPAKRLFGLRYNYNEYDGSVRNNVALFCQGTVESWLQLTPTAPTEPIHWVPITKKDATDMRYHPGVRACMNTPDNLEGFAVVGRRLFWGERWVAGWGFNVVDYNFGASAILGHKKHGVGGWQSSSSRFTGDRYPAVLTTTRPMPGPVPERLIATEEGILLKFVRASVLRLTDPDFLAFKDSSFKILLM
ncbi:hypothetical protein C8R46DRAFT_1123461 [Mycena filopes]|nr:hypothetical protein C8R46DRAFT_1123461 [Mycena filopes]